MKYFKTYMAALLLTGFASFAYANQGDELAYFPLNSLETLAVASIDETADYVPIYDASAQKVKKVLARPDNSGITSSAAEINYNDITTLGTLQASKTWTSDASLDSIMPTGGLLTVQSGGAITLNSGSTLTVAGTLATTGAITATGNVTQTKTTSADSATTNKAYALLLTAPVDTTGTNTHEGIDVALTVSNATGGTNTVNGLNFANYTGDAQVNVNAIKIGTSDGLGTAKAISIGTGWDAGIDIGSPITGSGLSTVSNMVGFTRQINSVTTTTATAAQCGSVFTNSGAGVVTLPEASTVLGCSYLFVTGNASNFDVNPSDGTDQISLLTNAAGDAVRNATVGNSLCLIAVSNDAWHQCAAPVGTWSDVN